MKSALICGVSGQDGAYLAQLLLKLGYNVCGTSRDAQMSSFPNLVRLGIRNEVKLESVALTDFRSVLQVLTKIQPDEVYNQAGQSSVSLSFATGESHKLEDFVEAAKASVGLDWRDHVVIDASPLRPTDIAFGRVNQALASAELGRLAQYKMKDVAGMMVEAKSGK